MSADYLWRWTGRDNAGRPASGELQAPSARIARIRLQQRGLAHVRLKRAGGDNRSATLGRRPWLRGGRLGPGQSALVARQLATMLRAGAPLVRALDVTASGLSNPRLAELVRQVRADVAGGESLATALGRRPQTFDRMFCALVHAGEQAGTLDVMLLQIAAYQERARAVRARAGKAMAYPAVVVMVAGVVTAVLLIQVVPRFETVFASFNADLPAFTRIVIQLSEWLQASWLWLLAAPVALLAGIALQRRIEALQRGSERLILRLPIVGRLVRTSVIARFGRTLATTFAAGVPLIEALTALAATAGNRLFEDALHRIRSEVAAGASLHRAMQQTRRFPDMMIQMTRIGEEAGALDDMLARTASHYEAQLEGLVDSLTALMEPLIMVVLGVIVGGLVIAMYLPIFQMGTAIGG